MIKRVLILEDDLETLSTIFKTLRKFEVEIGEDKNFIEIATTVFSEYTKIEKWLNKAKKNEFEVILMDRDCILGGSFHCLDFGIYNPTKVIGISSMPPYNEELKQIGVKALITKDYRNLDEFSSLLEKELRKLLIEEEASN